jgi:hypothetical protein
MLIERSHIRLDDLQDQDNRIPLANYTALLKAVSNCATNLLSRCFLARRSGCRTYRSWG